MYPITVSMSTERLNLVNSIVRVDQVVLFSCCRPFFRLDPLFQTIGIRIPQIDLLAPLRRALSRCLLVNDLKPHSRTH